MPDTYLGGSLGDTGRGSFVVIGKQVSDSQALSQMDIPGHETCIEVPKEKEVWFGGAAAG